MWVGAGETDERQPAAGGEGEGPPECEYPPYRVPLAPSPLLQAKEEVEALEKKMVQLENELSSTTAQLENSNKRLEEREKALQNVSRTAETVCMTCFPVCVLAWVYFCMF